MQNKKQKSGLTDTAKWMNGWSAAYSLLFICFITARSAPAYTYDPNDFAVEAVSYVQGTGVEKDYITGQYFNNKNNALGRPTIDTTGDNWNIPTSAKVPAVYVYQPFRYFELVTIGLSGQLVLKFNHPVCDDENNPYGIDLIVFGNAQGNSGTYWTNGNPENYTITGSSMISEAGKVSVSQDGINWYRYDNGPFADTFAPTLGRVYDPNNPDTSIGTWNHWWSAPTDPTLPLDPSLSPAYFAGKTVAQTARIYGRSAGGTGFDLSESGMDWIQYVKIESSGNKPEIDAIADVSGCGDYKHPYPQGDTNMDCRVNMLDLAVLCQFWLADITVPDDPAKTADVNQDDFIDYCDIGLIAGNWLNCNWQCD